MSLEERDQPPLDDLYTEVENLQKALDARPDGTIDAVVEIKNTLLPLLKDIIGATLERTDDLYDMVRPIELGRDDADEIGSLLGALRAQSEGKPELLERIDGALSLLTDGDDEDDDDEEGPESGSN